MDEEKIREDIKQAIVTVLTTLDIDVDKIHWFVEGRVNPVTGEAYTLSDIGCCDNVASYIDGHLKCCYPAYDGSLACETMEKIINYNIGVILKHYEEHDEKQADAETEASEVERGN